MRVRFAPQWVLTPTFWADVFGNDHPVAVEIGPGRGEFLEAAARAEPSWNFFAIEQDGARASLVRKRIETRALPNARIVCAPAEYVLAILPDACVDRFHIQFPDPWWKRRHHRRRLIKRELVAELHRTMRQGATIDFLTDVDEYFALAQRIFAEEPGLVPETTAPELLTTTSFARKASERGWDVSAATYRKQ